MQSAKSIALVDVVTRNTILKHTFDASKGLQNITYIENLKLFATVYSDRIEAYRRGAHSRSLQLHYSIPLYFSDFVSKVYVEKNVIIIQASFNLDSDYEVPTFIMDIVELGSCSFTRYQRVLTSDDLIREEVHTSANFTLKIQNVSIIQDCKKFEVTSALVKGHGLEVFKISKEHLYLRSSVIIRYSCRLIKLFKENVEMRRLLAELTLA